MIIYYISQLFTPIFFTCQLDILFMALLSNHSIILFIYFSCDVLRQAFMLNLHDLIGWCLPIGSIGIIFYLSWQVLVFVIDLKGIGKFIADKAVRPIHYLYSLFQFLQCQTLSYIQKLTSQTIIIMFNQQTQSFTQQASPLVPQGLSLQSIATSLLFKQYCATKHQAELTSLLSSISHIQAKTHSCFLDIQQKMQKIDSISQKIVDKHIEERLQFLHIGKQRLLIKSLNLLQKLTTLMNKGQITPEKAALTYNMLSSMISRDCKEIRHILSEIKAQKMNNHLMQIQTSFAIQSVDDRPQKEQSLSQGVRTLQVGISILKRHLNQIINQHRQ